MSPKTKHKIRQKKKKLADCCHRNVECTVMECLISNKSICTCLLSSAATATAGRQSKQSQQQGALQFLADANHRSHTRISI